MRWEDGRYAGKKNSFQSGYYNEHRKTGCPSNHIPYEDTITLWRPNLQLLNALKLVMIKPTRSNDVMKYDVKTGLFSFWVNYNAKIKCPMDYTLYPFDTQTCQFTMISATKNLTYQVGK